MPHSLAHPVLWTPALLAGVGSPFDPNVHEAIMREPNDDVADGTVLEEFRKGFRLGDQLLRPAMVKVGGWVAGCCICWGWQVVQGVEVHL